MNKTTNDISIANTKTIKKTCFVVMPISDMPPYPEGHFHRVLEHLITPACNAAGFEVIRADKIASTHLIILNIIKNILDADLVICDISGKNPNVMYELGVRHSFNLPTVLIKDHQTSDIFDIQGMRYTRYDENLRVDNIQRNIESLIDSIRETTTQSKDDVNSFVNLLNISAAKQPAPKEIHADTLIVLDAISKLEKRLDLIEDTNQKNRNKYNDFVSVKSGDLKFSVGDYLYLDSEQIGQIKKISNNRVFTDNGNSVFIDDIISNKYMTLPF